MRYTPLLLAWLLGSFFGLPKLMAMFRSMAAPKASA